MERDRQDLGVQASTARVDMRMRLSRFALPPVQSALAIGKRAGIGSRAIAKALEEMMPGAFTKIDVDHPLIEAVLVRDSHLRRVPPERLVPVLIRHAETFMTDTDTVHFDITVEVQILESLDI